MCLFVLQPSPDMEGCTAHHCENITCWPSQCSWLENQCSRIQWYWLRNFFTNLAYLVLFPWVYKHNAVLLKKVWKELTQKPCTQRWLMWCVMASSHPFFQLRMLTFCCKNVIEIYLIMTISTNMMLCKFFTMIRTVRLKPIARLMLSL